ncbi:hypothetical protein PtA15_3A821 [Puccinia triticina]|uniref:Uncharacterized protein n=1 Tax=Puccinia triticina TaxID=208348 RepID=A0ABY7CI02_9BASI|nr:uncharacterized protein PtA15_3A821 [Puccinia triticina]WAQ83450.1 hypothetical protein PtA15_3A821 [Puccinia triticina]WAR54288.1 hypothetical protein PtB15_3B802 [Puccinia triticina]
MHVSPNTSIVTLLDSFHLEIFSIISNNSRASNWYRKVVLTCSINKPLELENGTPSSPANQLLGAKGSALLSTNNWKLERINRPYPLPFLFWAWTLLQVALELAQGNEAADLATGKRTNTQICRLMIQGWLGKLTESKTASYLKILSTLACIRCDDLWLLRRPETWDVML